MRAEPSVHDTSQHPSKCERRVWIPRGASGVAATSPPQSAILIHLSIVHLSPPHRLLAFRRIPGSPAAMVTIRGAVAMAGDFLARRPPFPQSGTGRYAFVGCSGQLRPSLLIIVAFFSSSKERAQHDRCTARQQRISGKFFKTVTAFGRIEKSASMMLAFNGFDRLPNSPVLAAVRIPFQ